MNPGEKLGNAVAKAKPGDRIFIKKGVYSEALVIDKPVQLIGEEGAVIDPSSGFSPNWEAAPEIGPGVWKYPSNQKIFSLMMDGKVIARIRFDRTQSAGAGHWKHLIAHGMPSGFKYIRGAWIYDENEKMIYVHLDADAEPKGHSWKILTSEDPAVLIKKAESVLLENITVANGFRGIVITDDASKVSVLRCAIGSWEQVGIQISSGARNCLIESNKIFRTSLENFRPEEDEISSNDAPRDIWRIHKNHGSWDRIGIDFRSSGPSNRVHANRIFQVFDGIVFEVYQVMSYAEPPAVPLAGLGTEIWENWIEDARDSGIEIGGGAVQLRVHDNALNRTQSGIRFKIPRIGPVFVYRNIIFGGVGAVGVWFSMDSSPAEGYVYHNTVVNTEHGFLYDGWNADAKLTGYPNFHFINNLAVVKRRFWVNGTKYPIEVSFKADYNLGFPKRNPDSNPWPGDTTKDQHSRYLSSFELSDSYPPKPFSGSQAVDAGLDLSRYRDGKPLPGCAPGYFKGKAPDIGAVEIE